MNISWIVISGREGEVDGGVAHGSHSDDKSRVVGALYNIVIELNDLFYPRDWEIVSIERRLVSGCPACTDWEAQSAQ